MRFATLVGLVTLAAAPPLSCAPAKPPAGTKAVASAPPPSPSTEPSPKPLATTSETLALGTGRAKLLMLSPERWSSRDAIDLGDGSVLHVGDGGERWFVVTKKAPTKDDPDATDVVLRSASAYLPENLVAVRKRGAAFVFVGASGSLYEADAALAEPKTRRAPPSPMRMVSAGKEAIFGLSKKGELLSTTDAGASWKTIALPLEGRIPLRIAASARGEALVLAAPQRLFASFDDGATFGLASATMAVASIDRAADDRLFAMGAATVAKNRAGDGLAAFSVGSARGALARGTNGAPFLERTDKISSRSTMLPTPESAVFIDYLDTSDGRGALIGSRWYEVLNDGAEEAPVRLAVHDLAALAPPSAKPIPKLLGCTEVLLAGSDAGLFVGCIRDETDKKGNVTQVLALLRTKDAGATYSDEGKLVLRDDAQARKMWPVGKNAVLVQGGEGLVLRTAGKGATKVQAPEKDPQVLDVASTSDGTRVAVLVASEANSLQLWSSKDGGKSFVARSFPSFDESEPSDPLEVAFDESATPPTLIAFVHADGLVRYESKDDGATFKTTKLPIEPWSMSLAGRRGLATEARGVAWETFDGGLTWTRVALPHPRGGDDAPVACSADACVVGSHVARIGWEIATAADAKPVTSAPPAPPKPLVHATPLACTTTVELGAVSDAVTPADPGSGLAWFGLERDGDARSIVSLSRDAKTPALEKTPLLAAAKGDFGTWDAIRPEAVVALRQPIVRKKEDAKAHVDVEIAWWLAATKKVHRATLKGVGEADFMKHVWTAVKGPVRLRASAIVVPGAGLLVRPFAAKNNDDLFFVDEAGKVTKGSLPKELPSVALTAFKQGGDFVLFGANDDRQAFVGTLTKGGALTARFFAAWPKSIDRDEALPRISTTLWLGAPHAVIAFPGDRDLPAKTFGLPLAADGPLIALPTIDDLGSPPRACAAEDAGGARIELPWSNGKRHPLLVTDDKRTPKLATFETIVRSQKGRPPCVSAWTAALASGSGDRAVVSSTLVGTLFVDNSAKGERSYTAKAMTCAWSNAPLPPGFSGKGFSD